MTGEDTNQLYYWRLLIKSKDREAKAAGLVCEGINKNQSMREIKSRGKVRKTLHIHIINIRIKFYIVYLKSYSNNVRQCGRVV